MTALTAELRTLEDKQSGAATSQSDAEEQLRYLDRQFMTVSEQRQVETTTAAEAELRQIVAQTQARVLAERAALVQDFLDELVVSSYVSAGEFTNPLDSPSLTRSGRRNSYSRDLLESKRAEKADRLVERAQALKVATSAESEHDRATRAVLQMTAQLAANRTAVEQTFRRREQAQAESAQLAAQIKAAESELAVARRTATVVGLDFTLVVFDAFIKAVGLEAAQRPACRVQWPLLAAISRVESRHGTFGTSIVDPFGQVTPPIIGPPLNGLGFAYIADSDGGLYDFDTVYDRAVGPMQFIPSSWAIFGRDGDGDGRRDPNNYYDATVAAAEHLCRSGVDVGTESGAQSAVFGYNQSNDYVALVLSLRDLYAAYRPSSLVVSVR